MAQNAKVNKVISDLLVPQGEQVDCTKPKRKTRVHSTIQAFPDPNASTVTKMKLFLLSQWRNPNYCEYISCYSAQGAECSSLPSVIIFQALRPLNHRTPPTPTPSHWLRLPDTLSFDIGEPAMFREFLRRRLHRRWARIPETNEDDFGTYLLAESQTVDDTHGLSSSYESVSPYSSMTPPTQTTETRSVFPTEVLSEGCVSHGSSSTESSDALSADSESSIALISADSEKADADSEKLDADSEKPDADSEKPDGVCFAKYCDSCQEARMSSDYANRILNLMTPLYCTACRKERPLILFSYSSRRESSATRVCIGHQGYRPICPHLKVSFADIERWMIEGKQIEITCNEVNCPAATATVCYRASSQKTTIEWTVTLDRHFSNAMVWDNCRTKLKELHQSFPAFLCPHFKTTPDRLFYPEHFERSSLAWCGACKNLICLRQEAEVDRIKSIRFLGSGASSMDELFNEWIGALDPESYGHFDDQDTKCLTWCDDRYCITTCELLHFSALTSVPAIHSVSDCHEEEGRSVVRFVDWKVKCGINRSK